MGRGEGDNPRGLRSQVLYSTYRVVDGTSEVWKATVKSAGIDRRNWCRRCGARVGALCRRESSTRGQGAFTLAVETRKPDLGKAAG